MNARGELLTLVTDGVVEAIASKGKFVEFDRTKAISRKPAVPMWKRIHCSPLTQGGPLPVDEYFIV